VNHTIAAGCYGNHHLHRRDCLQQQWVQVYTEVCDNCSPTCFCLKCCLIGTTKIEMMANEFRVIPKGGILVLGQDQGRYSPYLSWSLNSRPCLVHRPLSLLFHIDTVLYNRLHSPNWPTMHAWPSLALFAFATYTGPSTRTIPHQIIRPICMQIGSSSDSLSDFPSDTNVLCSPYPRNCWQI
jgi:hypothetical protein